MARILTNNISKILAETKPLHKKSFIGSDHEQSWRSFKGKNLEKLIIFIIEEEVKELRLCVVEGNKLERTKEENLSNELSKVKRNLLIDYGEFGYHLPDVDISFMNLKALGLLQYYQAKLL